METGENFTGNAEEHLRIDNEIMRLKLFAAYGDNFKFEPGPALPPHIENQFLKNIIATEKYFRDSNPKKITIYEKIGKPTWRSSELLGENEMQLETQRLLLLLSQHGIDLDFIHGPYNNEVVYSFITEEFFLEEIEDIPIPGIRYGFIYEEFHINNKAEIKELTHWFFYHWLARDEKFFSAQWAESSFIDSKGNKLTSEKLSRKIKLFTDCFIEFKNGGYDIDLVQVDEQPDGTALGFCEGVYKYEAVAENNETQVFEGPFKIYLRREHNYWDIFSFSIPGLES